MSAFVFIFWLLSLTLFFLHELLVPVCLIGSSILNSDICISFFCTCDSIQGTKDNVFIRTIKQSVLQLFIYCKHLMSQSYNATDYIWLYLFFSQRTKTLIIYLCLSCLQISAFVQFISNINSSFYLCCFPFLTSCYFSSSPLQIIFCNLKITLFKYAVNIYAEVWEEGGRCVWWSLLVPTFKVVEIVQATFECQSFTVDGRCCQIKSKTFTWFYSQHASCCKGTV